MTREKKIAFDLNEYCLLFAETMDVETVKAFQHVSGYLYERNDAIEAMMGGEFIRRDPYPILSSD